MPGSRCSQLSTTSTTSLSPTAVRIAVVTTWLGSTSTPSAVATAPGTSPRSAIGARSTKYGPTAYRSDAWAASSSASRVLPIPPTPVSVTSRSATSIDPMTLSSSWRPTIAVSGAGRFAGPRPIAPAGGRQERRIVVEDGLLDGAQRRAGLDAEVGGEGQTGTSEGSERVGRSPGLVERPHQQPPGPLAVRVGLDEGFELADPERAEPPVEVGLGAVLGDRVTHLDETLDLAHRHRALGHAVVGRAAERGGGAGEQPGGSVRIAAAEGFSRLRRQVRHGRGVDLDDLGIESIAAVALDDREPTERSAETHDVGLQGLAPRRRRSLRPQRVGERVDRHRLAHPRCERRQQGLLGGRDPHRRAAVEELDRAEDPHLEHAATLVRVPPRSAPNAPAARNRPAAAPAPGTRHSGTLRGLHGDLVTVVVSNSRTTVTRSADLSRVRSRRGRSRGRRRTVRRRPSARPGASWTLCSCRNRPQRTPRTVETSRQSGSVHVSGELMSASPSCVRQTLASSRGAARRLRWRTRTADAQPSGSGRTPSPCTSDRGRGPCVEWAGRSPGYPKGMTNSHRDLSPRPTPSRASELLAAPRRAMHGARDAQA